AVQSSQSGRRGSHSPHLQRGHRRAHRDVRDPSARGRGDRRLVRRYIPRCSGGARRGGDLLRQHHGLQFPRVLLRRGRVLRIHRQRGPEPGSWHPGDEGPHGSSGGGRLLETPRACLRGERAKQEAPPFFRLPRGGGPRETCQARRGMARRRDRRAASPGQPV
ncbi:Acetyltransferase, GNAT family, partial [uncultured Rubrobacteraceae bacterium]